MNMPKQRAFLSGPMASRPDFNFPLFDHVALRLGDMFEVYTPAQHARRVYGSLYKLKQMSPEQLAVARRGLMAFNLHWLCTRADIIFMLPEWEKSMGAWAEHEVAVACGIEIRAVPEIMLPDNKVMVE